MAAPFILMASAAAGSTPLTVSQEAAPFPYTGSINSYTQSLTSVGTGHSLLVASNTANLISSISDNAATPYTWSRVKSISNTNVSLDVWLGTGGSGGSVTVTVNLPSTGQAAGLMFELNGTATVQSSNSGSGTSATPSSPTITPSSSGCLGFNFAALGNGATSEPLPPWVADYSLKYLVSDYQPELTNGDGYSVTWGQSSSSYSFVGVVFAGTGSSVQPLIAPVGSPVFNGATTGTTLPFSFTAVNIGDVVIIGSEAGSQSNFITGVSTSGTGVIGSWTKLVRYVCAGPQTSLAEEIWQGIVTTPGACTITATYNVTVTQYGQSGVAQEFQKTGGSWGAGSANSDFAYATTNITMPTLTPSVINQMYIGLVSCNSAMTAGSTPGYYYCIGATDALSMIFNTHCAVSAQAPTLTESTGQGFDACAILVTV